MESSECGYEDEGDGDIAATGGLGVGNLEEAERVMERSPKGRFARFNRILGSGSYKVVYLGFDHDTGREVAWNVVSFLRLTKHDRKRLDGEVRVLSSLNHPRIIKFVSAWINRDKNELVFITERVSGGSLRSYIHRIGSPLKVKVIRNWCKQILEGVAYLHSLSPAPIIHRDLKCDNIFVHGNEGSIVIGDLGLCTSFTSGCPHYTLVGTPNFIAPELYEESSYGPPIDMYAFGMCMLEMVAQRYPYSECASAGQIYRKVIRGELPADVSRVRNREIKSIIEACLSTDPAKRPTASSLLADPFWNSSTDASELADLLPELIPSLSTSLTMAHSSKDDELLTESDLISFSSDKSDEGSVAENFETSLERKGSVSFGSYPATNGKVNDSLLSVSPAISEDCHEDEEKLIREEPPTLTRANLEMLPETANVESACRVLGIERVDHVKLYIEEPRDLDKLTSCSEVTFDYVLSQDSPGVIAQQLVDEGLVTSQEMGGPSLDRVVSKINEALLIRVQEMSAICRFSVNSYPSTRSPSV